jgi:hypothetical protein
MVLGLFIVNLVVESSVYLTFGAVILYFLANVLAATGLGIVE